MVRSQITFNSEVGWAKTRGFSEVKDIPRGPCTLITGGYAGDTRENKISGFEVEGREGLIAKGLNDSGIK